MKIMLKPIAYIWTGHNTPILMGRDRRVVAISNYVFIIDIT